MPRKVWFQLLDAATGDAFAGATADSLRLPEACEDISDLRKAIKAECPNTLASVDAANLRVFANRPAYDDKNGQLLEEDSPIGGRGGSKDDALIVEVLQPLHRRLKRVRVNEWFPSNELSSALKRARVDDQVDDENEATRTETKYFDMAGSPPVRHLASRYKRIVDREAYHQYSGHVVVTGNPGIGKSRFYLYCTFRLVTQLNTAKPAQLFVLVLNCLDINYVYEANRKEFRPLTQEEVGDHSSQPNVLRLVDGNSNRLEQWRGVSALFASPGVSNFQKDECQTFIMPVWTLDELKDCNEVLDDNVKLKVDDLEARYYKFGGIARSVFSQNQDAEDEALESAIESFDALKVIEFARAHHAVREDHDSHRVLQIVPRVSSYREASFLFVLSEYIGDRLIEKADDDSREKLSAFAIAHSSDNSGSTAPLRGKIYELLSHKWFMS